MPEGRLRTADGQVDVRIHDLRRTPGTLLGEIGLTPTIGLVLNRVIQSHKATLIDDLAIRDVEKRAVIVKLDGC